ncbi:hypothetical protein W97_03306 [Coniosporium apollinis CBS 100218]|uniref:Amine oxidase domain-containing protein n=1 Tax=Coniosporium apollinis (strain CBS 100218) TaxID=1168221 RepID=R7YR15_CONA1|nr:uncharacterized protein W97_03306 [Coniosporium apollinis CBS 100218]EON64076.1 hypothetical protein W97_03306 [Coniosporium apollinis CBS 100218]
MSRIQQDLSSSLHRQNPVISNGVSPSMLRRALSGGGKPHIGIVGAGFAGLRCADVLLQHGAKVTILEARNRVGGRLCQGEVNGHLVDLGPNWIHGTDHNPILDLAKETNTLTHTWDGRQSVFDHLGDAVPAQDAAEYTELVWKVIGEAYEYVNEHGAEISPSRSLWDFFKEKSKEIFPDSDPDAESKRDTLTSMAEMWGAFVGSPIQRQSLKFFWLEECIEGENLFVAETYRKVLERVAKPVLAGAEVKFGCNVSGISSIWEGKQAPNVYVDVAGGDSFTFDEVVVTTPLGWLKKNKKAFKPALPNRLSEAINAIGYGCLDKTYITFQSAFWESAEEEEADLTRIPSNEQRKVPNVTATTAPLHQPEPQDASSSKHYPGFTHWTRPFYAKSTNPDCWNQECVNLAALPSSVAHPTLLFYHYGAQSQWISSLLRTEPDWKRILLDFFQPYFSRLPNYSPDSDDCKPTDLLTTGWAGDEFAGHGSYCNFQVGLEKGDEDIEVMRDGMPERGVWLAGEHTAPFVALGTVTGAYWSGQAVALRIAKAHRLECEMME